jgi:hypothetical protein
VWATVRASGRQVACFIGDREKVSPKSFGIRIRDPANSEFPIEGQKVEKSNPHVYRGIGTSGFGVWKFRLLTSRVAISR